MTIYFRAEIGELLGDRNLSVISSSTRELRGFFRFSKAVRSGFLVVDTAVTPMAPVADLWTDT